MKFTKSLLAAATASLLALAPLSSQAALILTLDDLSTPSVDVKVTDFSTGFVTYTGAAGTWVLNFTTGLGTGLTDNYALDLNSLSVSSSGGGSLRISLTETDLSWPTSTGALSLVSSIGVTTYGSVSYAAYADDSNAEFGKSTLIMSGSASGFGSAFSGSGSTNFARTDPFSLTLEVDITHTGRASTSFDFDAHVPEPGTLALLSAALLGAGLASRRRRA